MPRLERRQGSQRTAHDILGSVAKFSAGSFVGAVGAFATSYFAAALLGPTVWGVWLGARIIADYGANLHFGTHNALHREIPFLRGRGDVSRQELLISTAFAFTVVMAVLVASAVMAVGLWWRLPDMWAYSVRAVALIVAAALCRSFFESVLRGENRFDVVARISTVDGVVNLFTIALLLHFGVVGFLIGQIIRYLAAAVYAAAAAGRRFRWRIETGALRSLIGVGFPIMLMVSVHVLFSTVDRLVILKYLDEAALGVYSLGLLAFAPLQVIVSASNAVLYPRAAEQYGVSGDIASLKRFVTLPLMALAWPLALTVGAIVVLLPVLVETFLPDYRQGISAARWLLIGLYCYGLSGPSANLLLTINRQMLRLALLAGAVIVNGLLSVSAIRLGLGIEGVAIANATGYCTLAVVTTSVGLRLTRSHGREVVTTIGKILVPTAAVIMAAIVAPPAISQVLQGSPGLSVAASMTLLAAAFAYPVMQSVRGVAAFLRY